MREGSGSRKGDGRGEGGLREGWNGAEGHRRMGGAIGEGVGGDLSEVNRGTVGRMARRWKEGWQGTERTGQ